MEKNHNFFIWAEKKEITDYLTKEKTDGGKKDFEREKRPVITDQKWIHSIWGQNAPCCL